MAEIAASLVLDAERGRKSLHLSHEVFRRQYFEILRRIILASALALGVKGSLRNRDHKGRKDRRRSEHRKDIPQLSHGGHFTTGSEPAKCRRGLTFCSVRSGLFVVIVTLNYV